VTKLSVEKKDQITLEAVNEEKCWLAVFKSFKVEIPSNGSAALEFKKAVYKHKFDRKWQNEITKI
jgi:hypothetical protein